MPWRASSVANIESAPPIARTSGASCSSRSNSRGGLLDIDCSDQIKRLPFRTYRGKCYPLPIIRQPIIRKHRQGSPREQALDYHVRAPCMKYVTPQRPSVRTTHLEIGRESCRERVCQYV